MILGNIGLVIFLVLVEKFLFLMCFRSNLRGICLKPGFFKQERLNNYFARNTWTRIVYSLIHREREEPCFVYESFWKEPCFL
jgi:hypothetical protein